jgi:hypothetical protein
MFIDAHLLEIQGGPLGFGQIILRGEFGLSENLGGPFFMNCCIIMTDFFDLSPSPPLPFVQL